MFLCSMYSVFHINYNEIMTNASTIAADTINGIEMFHFVSNEFYNILHKFDNEISQI